MSFNQITQKKWFWFIFSFLVLLIDQASKIGINKHFMLFESKPIIPMLNFTLAHNTGAAFSFLSNSGNWHQWFFTGFSFFMSLALIVWILRLPKNARLQCVALSLILGGALGNLIDRLRLGYVVDFIDVYYKNYHWPVFNIADSAICVGALLLFFELRKEV